MGQLFIIGTDIKINFPVLKKIFPVHIPFHGIEINGHPAPLGYLFHDLNVNSVKLPVFIEIRQRPRILVKTYSYRISLLDEMDLIRRKFLPAVAVILGYEFLLQRGVFHLYFLYAVIDLGKKMAIPLPRYVITRRVRELADQALLFSHLCKRVGGHVDFPLAKRFL